MRICNRFEMETETQFLSAHRNSDIQCMEYIPLMLVQDVCKTKKLVSQVQIQEKWKAINRVYGVPQMI